MKWNAQITIDEARLIGNKKAARELELIGEPPYVNLKAVGIHRKWLGKFGGQTVKGTAIGMVIKNITARELGLLGLISFAKGAAFSLKNLEEQVNSVNLIQEFVRLKFQFSFAVAAGIIMFHLSLLWNI